MKSAFGRFGKRARLCQDFTVPTAVSAAVRCERHQGSSWAAFVRWLRFVNEHLLELTL